MWILPLYRQQLHQAKSQGTYLEAEWRIWEEPHYHLFSVWFQFTQDFWTSVNDDAVIQTTQITDLGKKRNMTVLPAPSFLFDHLPTSLPGPLGWLCLYWSPICYLLLGPSSFFFFFLGSKLDLSFVPLGNKSSSENLLGAKVFKG